MTLLLPPDDGPLARGTVAGMVPPADRHRWFASMGSLQALAQSVFGGLAALGRLAAFEGLAAEDDQAFRQRHRSWPLRLQMHGAMAEYFLDLNRERTIEGLKAALARGRKGGRRRKLTDAHLAAARAMLKEATIPVAQIAERLGVSRTTFYGYFPAACSRNGAEAT